MTAPKLCTESLSIVSTHNWMRNAKREDKGLAPESESETLTYLLGRANGRLATLAKDKSKPRGESRTGAWKLNYIRRTDAAPITVATVETLPETLKGLRALASKRAIAGRSKMNKAALVAALS